MNKKTLAITALLSSLTGFNYASASVLSGDAKIACEVILCLSSGTRPSECNAPIRKYFSIKLNKPWKTINARRNFLALCPTNSDQETVKQLSQLGLNSDEQDSKFNELKNDLVQLENDCSAKTLNSRIEYKSYREDKHVYHKYRINPYLPESCKKLNNHEWTQLKLPIYTGDYSWVYYRSEIDRNVWVEQK